MNTNVKQAKKRKLSEYRDPDYQQKNETSVAEENEETCKDGELPSTSSAAASVAENTQAIVDEKRLQCIRDIIVKEFQREIVYHKQHLEEVDNSIEDAIKIFDKLRYKIVEDFYSKHDVQISAKEAEQLRGANTFFNNEPLGPQLPVHPALKKIIGKRPKSLTDAFRVHPVRAAAKNAQIKIDEVTNSVSRKQQQREERRLQKIIKDKGIVIDHSKPIADDNGQNFDLEQAKLLSEIVSIEQKKDVGPNIPKLPLNTSRLNNKVKHLIVVGNTSQYIGNETVQAHNSRALAGQRISHKWLVYVQAKNADTTPLVRLVEKIRFFLHESYRPNDVVDIVSPPFQLSRRGWGEFPLRLQIHFNQCLQQKPIQLVHNIVLDKTLCGLQTMGAETLVEIWLRPLPTFDYNSTNISSSFCSSDNEMIDSKEYNKYESPQKRKRRFSIGQMKDDLYDNNIFDFLNKIESTPSSINSDLAAIEPTLNLNDSFTSILNSPTKLFYDSPTIDEKPNNKSPVETTLNADVTQNNQETKTTTTTSNTISLINDTALAEKASTTTTTTTTAVSTITTKLTTTTVSVNEKLKTSNENDKPNTFKRFGTLKICPQPATPKPSVINLKSLNAETTNTTNSATRQPLKFIGKAGTIVLPKSVMNVKPTIVTKVQQTPTAVNLKPKQTFEKKIVQMVDALGKIKYVQMLVATKTKSLPTTTSKLNVNTNTTTTTTITTTNNTILSRNIPNIFQKEGKLYVRDPQQLKLKQQQKQQTSLLKPQISLLKLQQTPALDHDYEPKITKATVRRAKKGLAYNLIEEELDEKSLEIKLIESFQRLTFASVRAAVEFLLRRLPLIAIDDAQLTKEFAFIQCRSEISFGHLTSFKQRSVEWMRAKYISVCLTKHAHLKHLIENNESEVYWTTREVVLFARIHGYTPPLKLLDLQQENDSSSTSKLNTPQNFAELVRKEMHMEQELVQYESLTSIEPILGWMDEMSAKIKEQGLIGDADNEHIDVLGLADVKSIKTLKPTMTTIKSRYALPVPTHLEAAADLVQELCRNISITLQPEEIVKDVSQPLAKIVLAQCVRIFVEQLIRRTIGCYIQEQEPPFIQQQLPAIGVRDIGKAIIQYGRPTEETQNNYVYSEYDFISDSYMGIPKPVDDSDEE